MKVIDLQDKTRYKTLMAVTVTVTLGVLIFLLFVFLNEPVEGGWAMTMLLVAAMVIILPIVLLLRIRRDMREGFPLVDERGRSVKMKAGYYSFMATIYIVLGFMYYDFIIAQALGGPSLSPTVMFIILDFVLLGVYLGFWYWFSKRGDELGAGD